MALVESVLSSEYFRAECVKGRGRHWPGQVQGVERAFDDSALRGWVQS